MAVKTCHAPFVRKTRVGGVVSLWLYANGETDEPGREYDWRVSRDTICWH